jgi:hypothetical protein
MAIAAVNAASSTASNWLKEAQESLAASEVSGGMMGALQDARSGSYSIKAFLAKSQNNLYALAQIAQSSQLSAGQLTSQMAQAAAQKRYSEQVALAAKLNPVQSNFNPPRELDPVIYFNDGSSIDTTSNIMTMSNGTQIDTTTGQTYIDPTSIVSMANGAYLDTKNNILTMSDGTKIDTVTGLKITV